MKNRDERVLPLPFRNRGIVPFLFLVFIFQRFVAPFWPRFDVYGEGSRKIRVKANARRMEGHEMALGEPNTLSMQVGRR